MKKTPQRVRNRLLRRLPKPDLERLRPHLKSISFEPGQVLYEPGSPIKDIYFPSDCVLSATVRDNGDAIEVGTIGNEGAAGLTAFLGVAASPHHVFAQIGGAALQIKAGVLEKEANRSRALYDLLLRHHHAFSIQISQSVACNGLHPLLKRCCRWLLMTHDRVEGDELRLTHEFLSFMLGVRRPGVTEALQALSKQGLIENGRGTITIVDRTGLEAASCPCYGIVVREYDRLLGPTN